VSKCGCGCLPERVCVCILCCKNRSYVFAFAMQGTRGPAEGWRIRRSLLLDVMSETTAFNKRLLRSTALVLSHVLPRTEHCVQRPEDLGNFQEHAAFLDRLSLFFIADEKTDVAAVRATITENDLRVVVSCSSRNSPHGSPRSLPPAAPDEVAVDATPVEPHPPSPPNEPSTPPRTIGLDSSTGKHCVPVEGLHIS
jgi:hypothetical protein